MITPRKEKGVRKNKKLKQKLRRDQTHAERLLWYHLKGSQFMDLKFRRQHGIAQYIVDFYCPEKNVVIEVDGDVHAFDENIMKDIDREDYLRCLGLQIIRYCNNDVLNNLDGVLENLLDCLK